MVLLKAYSSARVIHDHNAVREIMDFLEIDCSTVAVYRLGRFDPNRSRSIKVVLPASFFARLMLRRASRLRHFRVRGLFIRRSFSKEELERRRAERERNSQSNGQHTSLAPLQASYSDNEALIAASCSSPGLSQNVTANVQGN